MINTMAGLVFAILAVILINVYSQGGTPAVRSWIAAKFLNKPGTPPPSRTRRRVVRGPGSAGRPSGINAAESRAA
jgi:hypothetical protein